jgi:hypothetical protein
LFEEEVPLFLFFFAKKTSRRLEKRNFVLFPDDDDFKRF